MNLTVPTNWGEITIGQFIELNRANQLDLDPLESMIELLAILTKEDRERIDKISIDSIKKCYSKLGFLNTRVQGSIKEILEFDGVTYKADLNIKKFCAGQYLDLKNYTKDPKENLFNLHYIMTVFYIPVGKKYGEDYSLNDLAGLFYDKMSIEVSNPIAVFFSTLLKDWKIVIQDSLKRKISSQIMEMQI
jgi:hypothetical protein